MIPSKIKIKNFAKRYHMGTLGGKGLNEYFFCFLVPYSRHPRKVSQDKRLQVVKYLLDMIGYSEGKINTIVNFNSFISNISGSHPDVFIHIYIYIIYCSFFTFKL